MSLDNIALIAETLGVSLSELFDFGELNGET